MLLQIRPEHVSALAEQQFSGFVLRMSEHLRDVFPDEVSGLDDAGLALFVEKVCAQAEVWEIVQEVHVERLVELFASFRELRSEPPSPWLAKIVSCPDYTGERRLCLIEDRLLFAGDS